MLNTHISPSLIRELKEAFPERLPSLSDYESGKAAPTVIAFEAGRQDIIRYLEEVMTVQQQSSDEEHEEIHIL